MARPRKDPDKPVQGFTEGFGRRLDDLISELGGLDRASESSGISADTLGNYRSGRTRPDFFALVRLCEAVDKPITWLVSDDRPRDSLTEPLHVRKRTQQEHAGGEMLQIVDRDAIEKEAFVVLPRMDISAAAGSGRLTPDFPEVKGYVALGEDYLRSIGVPPRFARLLEIDGDSMFPTLKDRDVAVVDTSIVDVRSDAVYAVVYGGLVVAKRVQINRDGSVTLSSDNKGAGYRDERVAQGDLHELHVAGRIKGRVGGL